MKSFSREFLPFHAKKRHYDDVPLKIDSKPFLIPDYDPFDKPYVDKNDKNDKNDNQKIMKKSKRKKTVKSKTQVVDKPKISDDDIHNYDQNNMTFWWFIMGAIVISILLAYTQYNINGVLSDYFEKIKLYDGSPDPIVLMLGNTFLFLLLAWSTYHIYQTNNLKIIKYGALFLMVIIYMFMFMWSLKLYSTNEPRTSMLFLIFTFLFLLGYIILVGHQNINCNKSNYTVIFPLVLSIIWILYLLYYNLGIINLNNV